jgi:hypothetical protein
MVMEAVDSLPDTVESDDPDASCAATIRQVGAYVVDTEHARSGKQISLDDLVKPAD